MNFLNQSKNKGKSPAASPPQTRPSTPGPSMKAASSKPDKETLLKKGQVTLEAASKVLDILEDLGDTAPFLAPMKVVCGLLNDAVKRAVLVEQNDEELQGLSEELLQQLKHVEKYARDLSDPKFSKFIDSAKETLDAYTKDLNELTETLTTMQTRYESGIKNYAQRFLKGSSDRDEIQACRDKLKKSFKQFDHALVKFIARQTMLIRVELEALNLGVKGVRTVVEEMDAKVDAGRVGDAIDQLPYAIPSKQHGTCLEGTRQKIIEEIANWAIDPNAVPILALVDQAGTGKSTLATHMMEMWDKKDKHGYLDRDKGGLLMTEFYFCKPGTVTAERLASTLAKDMANRVPFLRPLILQALQGVKPLARYSIQKQLDEVIFTPLRSLSEPYIMAIDALDECSEEDRGVFLESTAKFLASYPNGGAPLKIFFTCRPESDLVSWMQKQMDAGLARRVGFSLHAEGARSNEDDIRLYVKTHLPTLTPEQIEQFVARAAELFIWASTARAFLNKAKNLKTRFKMLMSSESEESQLDDLYSEILTAALAEYEKEEEEDLRKVLQAICVAKEPLKIVEMCELLQLDIGVVDAIVKGLSSVLSDGAQDQPVHVLHPTFLEHLQNPAKLGPIFIDNEGAESLVAGGCLNSLYNGLKYDICGVLRHKTKAPKNDQVEDLGQRLGERTTQALRYAALHALSHVALCLGDAKTAGKLSDFFERKLLNWIELVSFLGKVYPAIQALYHLKCRLEDVPQSLSNTMLLDYQEWCDETLKLIQPFQTVIEASAMQVYFSALPFSANTRISRSYLPYLQQSIPKVLYQRTHSSRSKVLAGHGSFIKFVTVSSDGRYVISRDKQKKTWLWDAVTGGFVEKLEPNLSPDLYENLFVQPMNDRTFLVGLPGGIISLRNMRTGAVLWEIQCTNDTERGDGLEGVRFSSDGRWLALDYCGVMHIRDVETGQEIWRQSLEGSIDIDCISFSPDSGLLAHVDDAWVVRVWDIATGKSVVLPGMLDPDSDNHHSSLSFSSDGTILAGILQGAAIRLWYLKDGELVRHRDIANSEGSHFLAFSPFSQLLAYVFHSTIHLFDVASDKAFGEPLTGHTDRIHRLAFSSNGRTLVSGSYDTTVRIWELDVTEAIDQPLQATLHPSDHASRLGIHGRVKELFPSSFTRRLSRMFLARTVRQSSTRLEQVELNGKVTCLACSSDGRYLAFNYQEGGVCLWDIDAGKVNWQVNKGNGTVSCLGFSSDGRTLALACHYDVELWDVASGMEVGSVRGCHEADHLALSSDSSLIATEKYGYAEVWEVASRKMVARCLVYWTDSLSFHLHRGNNFLIISKKKIWDISAGRLYDSDENAPFKLVDLHSDTATFHGPWISIGKNNSFTFVLPPHMDDSLSDYKKGKFACGGNNGIELIVDCSHLI